MLSKSGLLIIFICYFWPNLIRSKEIFGNCYNVGWWLDSKNKKCKCNAPNKCCSIEQKISIVHLKCVKKKMLRICTALGWLLDHLNCSLSQHGHVQRNREPWLKTPFKWISIYSWFLSFSAIRYAHLCLNNAFSVIPFSTSFLLSFSHFFLRSHSLASGIGYAVAFLVLFLS